MSGPTWAKKEGGEMLKSCKWCGKVHDEKYVCKEKPVRIKVRNGYNAFRSTSEWQSKRQEIKERDEYLCQCCIRNFRGTIRKLNYKKLSVHHIDPLKFNYEKRLDDDNLITLCDVHHRMAEEQEIEASVLKEIALEQEAKKRKSLGYPPGIIF